MREKLLITAVGFTADSKLWRKADSKLFCADRTNYVMGGNDGPGHIAEGRPPKGRDSSSVGQLFCEREQCT